jgi:DNA-directed RNA polymerase specialized sigma24 family protein
MALTTADIASLYLQHAVALRRHVRGAVRAPRHIVEDACHHAWVQLVRYRDQVDPDTAHGWLGATAVREAIRLWGVWSREVSFEMELENQGDALLAHVPAAATPDEIVHRHDQLAEIRALPQRQQRMVWLRGLGLSPLELADHEHCTLRTVDRLLCRARQQLRAQAAEATRV